MGHKAPYCPRRAAGDSKLPNPGNNDNNNTGNGENDNNNNNNNGGSGKTKCGRCNGHHATESSFHDPDNASKRPDNWIVKKEFGTVAVGNPRMNEQMAVHKPDFSIIAIDKAVDSSSNNNNNNNNGAIDVDYALDSSPFF